MYITIKDLKYYINVSSLTFELLISKAIKYRYLKS